MEKRRNEEIAVFIESLGFSTYLPQRDAGDFAELVRTEDEDILRKAIFEKDVQAVRSSDVCLALLDGRVPDEGMCIEIGMAHALEKKIIGYMTDTRSFQGGLQNIMIEQALSTFVKSKEELKSALLKCK